MDWTVVAGGAVTALTAIATQTIGALSRRGDRKHEISQESSKRLWDGKREALIALIGWVKGVQAAATPAISPIVLQHRRSDILLFAMNNKMDFGDEVTAYAGQSVLECYERLQEMIEKAMQFPVTMMLYQLNESSQEQAAAERAWNASDKDFAQLHNAGSAAAKRVQIESTIDDATTSFDPDKVLQLADELLKEARRDLRASRP